MTPKFKSLNNYVVMSVFLFFFPVVGCGPLSNPNNGQVTVTDFTFGSEAHYSCTADCQPVGDSTRVCQADGSWSGSVPQCPGAYIVIIQALYFITLCQYSSKPWRIML